jgi:hypothetical protein
MILHHNGLCDYSHFSGSVLHGPGPIWTGTEWTDRDRDRFGPGSVGRSWEVVKLGRSRPIGDEMSDWTELAKNLTGLGLLAVKSMHDPSFILPKLGFSTLNGPETLYLYRYSLKQHKK